MANAIVQRNAFLFCRYSVAVLIWAALLLRSIPLLASVLAILALSALLTVRRAPMIWLYTSTLGRFVPSADAVLDVPAMRFAHSAGAAMAFVAVVLVLRGFPIAWWFVAGFAALKTLSAVGFCPAYKIYGCALKGGCCAVTSRR